MICALRFGWQVHVSHPPELLLAGPPGVIQSSAKPTRHLAPVALSSALWLANSCSCPAILRFTLIFNLILTVSSFSLQICWASHEYPKVCLFDRIIPLSKPTGDNYSVTKKHTQWIFFSHAGFLTFIYSFFSVFVSFCLFKLFRNK